MEDEGADDVVGAGRVEELIVVVAAGGADAPVESATWDKELRSMDGAIAAAFGEGGTDAPGAGGGAMPAA